MSAPRPCSLHPVNLPDNDTLVALVERMASGDAEALGELWDQVSPWVHAALLRMLRDEEAAELLTRATVIEMWRLAPMWDEHVGQPLLWAVANARNLGCQWLSERRRGHEDGPATTAPSAELIRDARDPASQVGAALAALGEAGHDTLEATWFSHPIAPETVRNPDSESFGPLLRDFGRALTGG